MNNLLVFGLVVLVAYSSSEPTKCYYCDNFSSCNDPFDVSQAEIMDCGNNSTDKLNADNTLTCVEFSGTDTNAGEHGTIRSCYPSVIGSSPVCDVLTEALSAWSDVSCTTCDTDLCNGN